MNAVNPALLDSGPDSPVVDIRLTARHADTGATRGIDGRGVVALLAPKVGLMSGPSERNVWADSPDLADAERIIEIAAGGTVYRPLYIERTRYGGGASDLTRYQCVILSETDRDMLDFDPMDFDPMDFG